MFSGSMKCPLVEAGCSKPQTHWTLKFVGPLQWKKIKKVKKKEEKEGKAIEEEKEEEKRKSSEAFYSISFHGGYKKPY